MNINAISSFNNVAKAQSFKAESSKLYRDPHEIIPPEISDDTVVDYSTWGDNYPVPITAGQRRAAQIDELAKIAAEAELEVIKLQADAAEYAGQKDAAIISQVRDALSKDPTNLTDDDVENLLVYYYILQWNGELPETYIGTEDFYAMLAALATKGTAGETVTP